VKIFDCPRCGERRSDAGMLGDTGVCLMCAETELIRLRALEAAVIEAVVPATKSRINAIAFYRQWSLGGRIADALEAE